VIERVRLKERLRCTKPLTTLRSALSDPKLLGQILDADSWNAWRVLLIAAMGEELNID